MYKRDIKGWAKHLDFMVLDCLCLMLSLLIAYMIRHGWSNPFQVKVYQIMFPVMLLLDFVLLLFMNTMKNVLKRGLYREFVVTMWQMLLLFLCTTGYMFTLHIGDEYSRMTIILMALIYGILSYITRLIWKKHVLRTLENSCDNALLIMATEESMPQLIEEVKQNNYGKNKIVGVVVHHEYKVGKEIGGVPVVATYESVVDYVTNHWVDEILIAVDPSEPLPNDTIDVLTSMGVTVHINLDPSVMHVGSKQVISNIGGLLVISTSMNYMTPRQAFAKRLLDIIGGVVGCIITGILYLVLAPLIKKESPGPVFFAQTRIGKNGKPFKFYKFRSMYLDAEERKKDLLAQNRVKDGMMFKMEFDPRIIGNRIDENGNRKTGIGEFIRKYSLDEFPQFYNVLRGDMSLVGTRPPLVDEYEKYTAVHKARLGTKPGITGMWQISGRSNILDFEEVVRLDTQYINNWSVGLDLKMLVKTVLLVLKKDGAM